MMGAAAISRCATTLALASMSPRRRRLLEEAGFAHEAICPQIDDAELRPPPGVPPRCWVAALSHLKARAGRRFLAGEAIETTLVLGADTVVVKRGEILGQPRDEAEAERMLRTLSDGSHEVLSGVTLLLGDRRWILVDSAAVQVGPLGEALIGPYLASGDWRGKAGGYNLIERIEAGWPIVCQGDPTTVMGLPMRMLAPRLRALLGRPAPEDHA